MIKYSINEKTVKGNKYYTVYFRVPMADGTKKAINKSTGYKVAKGNKRKAEEKAKKIVSEYEGLVYSDYSEMLLGDYVEDWIKRQKQTLRATTYDNYVSMLNKHIKPYFNSRKLKLKSIKPMHIQDYINTKLQEVSPNTVCKQLAIIKTAMQDAVINDIIKTNPCYKVKLPKKEKSKHDFYTEQELAQLLKVAKGTTIEVPIFLAIFFGLRRSEIIGLKWSAIDWENKTLEISGSVTREKQDDGKWIDTYSDNLKTESSHSIYQLNDTAYSYLHNLYLHNQTIISNVDDYKEYVCVNAIGERLKVDYVSHKFKKILRQNNLREITFHDLRHSVLSLLSNYYSMKNVQGYARHANFNITADTYCHIDNTAKLAETDTICNVLGLNNYCEFDN